MGVRGVVIASSVHEWDYERENEIIMKVWETMREKERERVLFCVTFWLWEKVDGAKDDGYQTR